MAQRAPRRPSRADAPTPATVPDIVQDTVQIGQTPGAPNTGQPPKPGETRTLRANAGREYLAGSSASSTWFLNLARSLEPFIDDLTAHVGDDVYRRMMADAQVASCINVFKAAVLETGPTFASPLADERDPDYMKALFIADWCAAQVADLARSIDDVLWNMTDAFFLGNKVAELVWDYSDQYWALPARPAKPGEEALLPTKPPPGAAGPQLILKDIKVKPREAVGFLVDAFMNVLGILGHIPGNYYPIMPGMVYASIDQIPNLLPVEKFAILSFRPQDSDPRGVSLLRPAYNAWYIKQQLWGEYTKFLSQMAGGLIIGKPDPSAAPLSIQNPDGSPTGETATPAETMVQVLTKARNGAVLVIEPGAQAEVHYPTGDGSAFLEGFSLLNLEIVKGILHVALATNEGEHNARSASEVHADFLSIIIRQAKQAIERMMRSIVKRMVAYNFGDAALRLVPRVSLGTTQETDRASLMASVAQLMGTGFFSPDQLSRLDEMLGLPVRLPEQQAQPDAAAGAPVNGSGQPATSGTDSARRDPRDMTHADSLHPEDTPVPASPGSYKPSTKPERRTPPPVRKTA